jgi:hypothetical protein
MESPHCKLGPGKCRDCDQSVMERTYLDQIREGTSILPQNNPYDVVDAVTLPPGWNMDHPWWPSSQMTDLQASHYDSVLQSVLALEKHEIQRIYEYLHKIGHTIYRE